MQAENGTGCGNGCDRDVVESLSITRGDKLQQAGLEFERAVIQERAQVIANSSRIFAITMQAFCSGILVNDPAVAVGNNNDVFNAGENRIVERQESHQFF